MIYLAALGMVLAVAIAVGIIAWTCVVRPERRRHAVELERARRERADDVARVAAGQLGLRVWNPVGRGTPTVRP